MLAFFYGNYEYWELRDRVTFDFYNRIIVVNPEVTTLRIKEDVYSAWKRWILVEQNTGKAPAALRTTGGDPTVSGQFAGDIYFTINGWRIQLDPSRVTIIGTIFSDDFNSPLINEEGVEIQQSLVSSLVSGVTTTENVITGDISTVPGAVRTELDTELTEISETRQRVDDIPGDIFGTPKADAEATPGSIGEWIGKKLLDFNKWFANR